MAHGDDFDVQLGQVGQQALGPFEVGEEKLEGAVLDAVDQFVAGPPGVDGNRHGAHRRDAHERGDPLGVVAQCDAHPIPAADATLVQPIGALRRAIPHFLIGEALILIDVEVVVGVIETACVERAQMGGRIREHGEIHTVYVLCVRLVRLASRGHRGDGGFEFRLHCLSPGERQCAREAREFYTISGVTPPSRFPWVHE